MALTGIFVFSWCHQAFLPLLVSGAYSLFLLILGKMGTSFLGGWKEGSLFHPSSLIMGSGLWMILVCVISAFGTGGMDLWRGLAVVLAVGELLWIYVQKKKGKNLFHFPVLEEKGQWDKTEGLMLAMILTCILIQAGRMNVALDYDSLHYGLRSPYILDNGRGIYENLGSVNVVYTYSKGLEVLALPLSGLPSYGFVLAFTIWQTVGVLVDGIPAGRSHRRQEKRPVCSLCHGSDSWNLKYVCDGKKRYSDASVSACSHRRTSFYGSFKGQKRAGRASFHGSWRLPH